MNTAFRLLSRSLAVAALAASFHAGAAEPALRAVAASASWAIWCARSAVIASRSRCWSRRAATPVSGPKPAQAGRSGRRRSCSPTAWASTAGWLACSSRPRFQGPPCGRERGVRPIPATDDGHGHAAADPHAWQGCRARAVYVANIASGLCATDAAGCAAYRHAEAYDGQLKVQDQEIPAGLGRDSRAAAAGDQLARRLRLLRGSLRRASRRRRA